MDIFLGLKLRSKNRFQIAELSRKILGQQNVASVSVVGNSKSSKDQSNEQFVQGLEKLALAMQGRRYIGIIVAENQSSQDVQILRKGCNGVQREHNKNLIMDCQSYTKYRPNETTGGIFVSWRRKEELPTGA